MTTYSSNYYEVERLLSLTILHADAGDVGEAYAAATGMYGLAMDLYEDEDKENWGAVDSLCKAVQSSIDHISDMVSGDERYTSVFYLGHLIDSIEENMGVDLASSVQTLSEVNDLVPGVKADVMGSGDEFLISHLLSLVVRLRRAAGDIGSMARAELRKRRVD